MPAKMSYVLKKPERCAVVPPDGEYTRLRQSGKYPELVAQIGKLLPRRAAQRLAKELNKAVDTLLQAEAVLEVPDENTGSQAVSAVSGVPLMTPLPVSADGEA